MEEIRKLAMLLKKYGLDKDKPKSSISSILNKVRKNSMQIKDDRARKIFNSSMSSVAHSLKKFIKDPSTDLEQELLKIMNVAKNYSDQKISKYNTKISKGDNDQERLAVFKNTLGNNGLIMKLTDFLLRACKVLFKAIKWLIGGFLLAALTLPILETALFKVVLPLIIAIVSSVLYCFVFLPVAGLSLIGLYMTATGKFTQFNKALIVTMEDLSKSDWNFSTVLTISKLIILTLVITAAFVYLSTTGVTGNPIFTLVSVTVTTATGILPGIILGIGCLMMATKVYSGLSRRLGFNYFTGPFQALYELFLEFVRLIKLLANPEALALALERFKSKTNSMLDTSKIKEELGKLTIEDIAPASNKYSNIIGSVEKELVY